MKSLSRIYRVSDDSSYLIAMKLGSIISDYSHKYCELSIGLSIIASDICFTLNQPEILVVTKHMLLPERAKAMGRSMNTFWSLLYCVVNVIFSRVVIIMSRFQLLFTSLMPLVALHSLHREISSSSFYEVSEFILSQNILLESDFVGRV